MGTTKAPFGIRDVRQFGAAGDGRTLDTPAIQAAIDACAAAGGGVVHCPPGTYLVGTTELKSRVNLHLEAGAVLLGSARRADYREAAPPSQADKAKALAHLIFARGAEDVSITGRGTIDGQGDAFFSSRDPGGGTPLSATHRSAKDWRPTRMVSFLECRNVLLEDVTLRNSPAYTVWPCGCDHVTIRGIRILNPLDGPNTDGVDPDCCSHVTISDCLIECGDDCIALKSDADRLGRVKACENVTVTNCVLTTTCCAIRVGYEGDAPIRHCTFSNLVMSRCRTGINMLVPGSSVLGPIVIRHGPTIENIRFSNLVMDTKIPIYLWIGDDASAPGCIRNISISDCFATTERGCYIGGARRLPIEGVRVSNFRLEVRGEMDDEFGAAVPYPYRVWDYFNKKGIPHAFYCRHARGLEFHDVRVVWGKVSGPWRSALRAEQVEDLDLAGFVAKQAPGPANAPVVHLTDARGVSLRGCRAEAGAGTFLRLDGAATRGIAAVGNDLSAAKQAVEQGPGVPADARME